MGRPKKIEQPCPYPDCFRCPHPDCIKTHVYEMGTRGRQRGRQRGRPKLNQMSDSDMARFVHLVFSNGKEGEKDL